MKKEHQYLIGGALISAAVLLGMGNVNEDKQTTEGRYQFVGRVGDLYNTPVLTSNTFERDAARTNESLFSVLDSETGTVSYVDIAGQTIVFPFATTKDE